MRNFVRLLEAPGEIWYTISDMRRSFLDETENFFVKLKKLPLRTQEAARANEISRFRGAARGENGWKKAAGPATGGSVRGVLTAGADSLAHAELLKHPVHDLLADLLPSQGGQGV